MNIVSRMDTWVMYALSYLDHPILHGIFVGASLLFEPLVLACFFAVLIVYVHVIHKDSIAVWYAVAVSVTFAIAAFLKTSIARSRPEMHTYEFTTLFEPAFPSAHAMVSLVTAFLGAYLITRRIRRRKWVVALWMIAIILVVLVGASRVHLGVHWPSDVIGGWFFGACILAAMYIHIKKSEKHL